MFLQWLSFFGMHLVWWFIWIMLLFLDICIAIPIPFQRGMKESALDILQKRFATGKSQKKNIREENKY